MSSIDFSDRTEIMERCFDVIKKLILENNPIPEEMETSVGSCRKRRPPLAVAVNGKTAGIIQLEGHNKDRHTGKDF